MDAETLRAGLQAAIPFNRYLGLEILEVGDGEGSALLPDDERLRNHVGSQHAGGLFSVAEAASGAAVVGALAEHMASVTPLARGAEIRYLKIARGPITARATLSTPAAELLARIAADGKVDFPVAVSLSDAEGVTVAEVSVAWYLRSNAPR